MAWCQIPQHAFRGLLKSPLVRTYQMWSKEGKPVNRPQGVSVGVAGSQVQGGPTYNLRGLKESDTDG